jgi:hypothetical protein
MFTTGSGYAAHLAHAGGVLYGTELGSVTLKRVGLFCFPIKHSTHTVNRGARKTHHHACMLGVQPLKRVLNFNFKF